jgi:CheY-like chemotaxis protein
MATKVFILANNNSASFLKNLVIKSFATYSREDGRKSGKRKDCEFLADKTRHFMVEVIDNYKTYNNFDFNVGIKIKKNHYETADSIFFFITPELFWKSENVDEGYEYALEIINHKLNKDSQILQFRFLSLLPFHMLLVKSRPHLKRFVESFPYYDLISEQEKLYKILFSEYTPTHYNLIKRLAVSDIGYINYLQHEVNGLINSRLPSEEKDKYVINGILNLGYLNKVTQLSDLTMNYTFERRLEIMKDCRDLLNDTSIKVDTIQKKEQSNLLPYRVLVVEDDPLYRVLLVQILEKYFSTVESIKPEKNERFTEALKKKLPKKAEEYDIVFLDLLFKNENGNWSSESGLDLYKNIKTRNGYCVTPVVTSLPRAVVASLVKDVDEAGIPYHLLLSKANGEDFLKFDVKDKLPDIIRTCKENDKKKKMFKPIPSEGIFKGHSVPGLMLNLMTEKNELFSEIVGASQSLFRKFKDGELNIKTPEWNKGELPSPKKIDAIDESYLYDKLPSILTHRLMVIDFALKNEHKIVDAEEYKEKILNVDTCNISTFDKGYLNTKLGFHIESIEKNNKYKIEFRNFFPHELIFVSENLKKVHISDSLEKYDELHQWFIEILLELKTYENWEELKLSFCPYKDISQIDKNGRISITDIEEKLTLANFIDFLNSLIIHFNNDYVIKIKDITEEKYQINESKTSIPQRIKELINQIFES